MVDLPLTNPAPAPAPSAHPRHTPTPRRANPNRPKKLKFASPPTSSPTYLPTYQRPHPKPTPKTGLILRPIPSPENGPLQPPRQRRRLQALRPRQARAAAIRRQREPEGEDTELYVFFSRPATPYFPAPSVIVYWDGEADALRNQRFTLSPTCASRSASRAAGSRTARWINTRSRV